jgi:6-phosphogluconolactonase (cycloisomerase 2 family)
MPAAPAGAYVVCELNSTILRCDYDPQTAALTPRHSKPAGHRRPTRNYPGVIIASAHHHRVYVANRGNDTIATVSPPQAEVTETTSGGSWPMDICVSSGTLLVANRDTSNIATFELDPLTGAPGRHTGDIAIPRPVSLLLTTLTQPRPS